jgi:Neuraminidase (sialidase)
VTETYPTEISTLPVEVAGARVLAWAETRRLEGNYPGGMVLARTHREYVIWAVYTKDGGETWHAHAGDYDHRLDDLAGAWEAFISRASVQLAEG